MENETVENLFVPSRPEVSRENLQTIEDAFKERCRLPARSTERELRIPQSTVSRSLKQNLDKNPNQISFLQLLLSKDYVQMLKRVQIFLLK